MESPAADLARRLARQAETVCRHYLPNGRREGRYWLAGDVSGGTGRSLYVRLAGPDHGEGAAGKWTDAATGEHGDLIDLIAANQRCATLRSTLAEARRFLALPQPAFLTTVAPAPRGSTVAARRLWGMAASVQGTVASRYLASRGITDLAGCASLGYVNRCWYRPGRDDRFGTRDAWPALVAAVRDAGGKLTGIHRTWLDPDRPGKAPVATPRRAMGHLLGSAIWFGAHGPALIAGEGIETVLSLRQAFPSVPAVAGLSAAHLSAVVLPAGVERLYLAGDRDPAGQHAVATLAARAAAAGIAAVPLIPVGGDFNDDLIRFGRYVVAGQVAAQPGGAGLLPFG